MITAPLCSDESAHWLSEVDRLIEFRDKRYYVGLPWLWRAPLDSNFAGAVHRLRRLVARLRRSGWYETYQTEIRALVDGGFAEAIPFSSSDVAFYMPHREVIRDNSATTKVRVVFDASAHRAGHDSLNNRLSKGVDLNPAILNLLVRFRFGKVAACADLMKAFLHIKIREADRDWLRFLWIDEDDRLVAYRMTSVPFGATCSPFLLAAVIRHHLWKHRATHPHTQQLLDRIYVDDLLITADSTEELERIKSESCDLFQKCSMTFRKWRCGDAKLDAE